MLCEENSLKKFLKDKKATHHFPAEGEATLSGIIIEADQKTGLAKKITRLITGRTQVPGLSVLIENDPIAWIFATDTFKWLFTWMGSMNFIAMRTDGLPLATGIPISVIWFIALTFRKAIYLSESNILN